MNSVTQLHSTTDAADRYQHGDIARALAEGLRHDAITSDIEQALFDLLFIAEEEDVLAARELLFSLFHALPE